jgi:hypothetical protein
MGINIAFIKRRDNGENPYQKMSAYSGDETSGSIQDLFASTRI